ncbi:MAG: TetR/AcrR family transcriptional regulator C-terminal domain-containing protein [Eggerthellaceae bacterium]|jgi:AcrR family transcriptional regulator|nr:TetR/AcrR family transcriptional regulator C-terminal domain-containing protein [Eggerthellaceae bacterium]
MTKFTEQAIQAAFIDMLAERPLDKITVREIAESCGISRNTFYYHYHDVYDLLDTLFKSEEERMLADLRDVSTMRQGLVEATRFAVENRKAIYHIYNSVSRDMLSSYLYKSASIYMRRYVTGQCGDYELDEKDLEDIVFLLASMIEGAVINILREGLSLSVESLIDNATRLFDGTVKLAIENCRKSKL